MSDRAIWAKPTEEFRSRAEEEIANYFRKNNIRFLYERRVKSVGKPDFYLPEYDLNVEYWGLVKAENEFLQKRYIKTMRRKMAQYHKKRIKFISLYPNNLENLDYVFRRKLEKVIGKSLPRMQP